MPLTVRSRARRRSGSGSATSRRRASNATCRWCSGSRYEARTCRVCSPAVAGHRQDHCTQVSADGVGASVAAAPGRYLGFLALYDILFGVLCWATFEYVVAEAQ